MGDSLRLYPDPILRQPCAPITDIDAIRPFAELMLSKVGNGQGRGLAAPQLGQAIRLFVTHVEGPKVYINPKITWSSPKQVRLEEGCRSLPWFTLELDRPERVKIDALDLDGNPFTEELDGWEGRIVQHEIDHLEGILHIDRGAAPIHYPDPKLQQRAQPVETFDESLLALAEAVARTMEVHGAVGLSANHLGVPLRLIVIALEGKVDCYVNPTLSSPDLDEELGEEGSISLPGIRAPIPRPKAITVTAHDLNGNPFTRRLEGFEARILMHENDQLNGTFFIQRIRDKKLKRRLDRKYR